MVASNPGQSHPGRYKTHTGIDIGSGYGTAAAADGVVTTAAYDAGGYGNYLIIDHGNGNLTLYAHMSQMSVGVEQNGDASLFSRASFTVCPKAEKSYLPSCILSNCISADAGEVLDK